MIKVMINNVIATASNLKVMTAGMVNKLFVKFEFTKDWDSLEKTALFTNGVDTIRVPEYKWSKDNVVAIPPEVLRTPHLLVKCGVYGIANNGELVIPTLWVKLGKVFPSASPGEYKESVTPPLSAWDDLQAQIGDIRDLKTEDKDNLVNAINNIVSSGGGGGTSFKPDSTLVLKDGVLSVNTTDKVEVDNTLPVTSAAVAEQVGNIEAILKTI